MSNLKINPETGVFSLDSANVPDGGWRNFSGGPTAFDQSNTKRYFNLFLSDEEAKRLTDQKYNVKWLEPKNPSEPKQAYLKVSINYDVPKRYQPRVWSVRYGNSPVLLDAEDLAPLDGDRFQRVTVQVRPFDWKLKTGVSGRKAMLSQMYVVLEQDEFGAEFWQHNDEDEEEIPFE